MTCDKWIAAVPDPDGLVLGMIADDDGWRALETAQRKWGPRVGVMPWHAASERERSEALNLSFHLTPEAA